MKNIDLSDVPCENCKHEKNVACCINSNCSRNGPLCYDCIYNFHRRHLDSCIPLKNIYREEINQNEVKELVEKYKNILNISLETITCYIKDQIKVIENFENISFTLVSDFSILKLWNKFQYDREKKIYTLSQKDMTDRLKSFFDELIRKTKDKCTNLFSMKEYNNNLNELFLRPNNNRRQNPSKIHYFFPGQKKFADLFLGQEQTVYWFCFKPLKKIMIKGIGICPFILIDSKEKKEAKLRFFNKNTTFFECEIKPIPMIDENELFQYISFDNKVIKPIKEEKYVIKIDYGTTEGVYYHKAKPDPCPDIELYNGLVQDSGEVYGASPEAFQEFSQLNNKYISKTQRLPEIDNIEDNDDGSAFNDSSFKNLFSSKSGSRRLKNLYLGDKMGFEPVDEDFSSTVSYIEYTIVE